MARGVDFKGGTGGRTGMKKEFGWMWGIDGTMILQDFLYFFDIY